MQETKTVYTTRELAEMAGKQGRPVTQEYIRQQCKNGTIPAERPSRDWLIPAYQAMAWLEKWLEG